MIKRCTIGDHLTKAIQQISNQKQDKASLTLITSTLKLTFYPQGGVDSAPPYLNPTKWRHGTLQFLRMNIHELIFQISANLVKIPLIFKIFGNPTSKRKKSISVLFTSMNFEVTFTKWAVIFSLWIKRPEILHVNVKMKIMNWVKNSVSLLKEFSGFEAFEMISVKQVQI